MPPISANPNIADRHFGDAILFCQNRPFYTGSSCIANLYNFFCCNFMRFAFLSAISNTTKNSKTVLSIFRRCRPFKIFKSIIPFDSVFVIAVRSGWIKPVECLKNKPVNRFQMLPSLVVKAYHKVRTCVFKSLKLTYSVIVFTSNVSSYVPKIANGIRREPSYWTPLLLCGRDKIRHAQSSLSRLTCLSARMVLAIRALFSTYNISMVVYQSKNHGPETWRDAAWHVWEPSSL